MSTFIFTLLALCIFGCSHAIPASAQHTGETIIGLDGNWEFAIDRNDEGIRQRWFARPLDDRITLPGSMPQRLKGDRPTVETRWTGSLYDSSFFYNPYMERYRQPDNLKLPFFLTPDRHYVGVAWYRRSVIVPRQWKRRRVVLFLERPHISTTLWVNDRQVGTANSLCAPHVYDVTDYLHTGTNTLALRIDNRIDQVCVGADSHSVTDQTQGNWNGIVGRMELQSSPRVYIEDLQVFPDIHRHTATVRLTLRRKAGPCKADIRLQAEAFNTDTSHRVPTRRHSINWQGDSTTVELSLDMGKDVQLWDEFHPALYRLRAELCTDEGTDIRTCTFGMREFSIDGKMFRVNGRLTLLRGTVENCDFPLTGYAPTDEASWERVFRICRRYGLNHMRFHSFCPPEAAFSAADKVGFYLQPEGPSWPNHGVKLGNGMPIDTYLMQETQRINKAFGNHASFCMLACGNEPAGNWVRWVTDFVDYWQKTDPRHVYTGASVGGGWAWQPRNMYHVKAGVRGLGEWGRRPPESTYDFRAKIDTVSVPFVSHETGQWCAFPNFDEIDKYTGVNKARNFEIFRDLLRDNGMADRAHRFLMASGKLQVICYKNELERTLRTPDYAGFQLLALNDYSGQGTALVGPLDVFFEEKGYVTADGFREFCSPTVLLARLPKFTYWCDEELKVPVEIAHFGRSPIRNAEVTYRITDAYGRVLDKGVLCRKGIPLGHNIPAGQTPSFRAPDDKARKLTLHVQLHGTEAADGSAVPVEYHNHWDFWVYPRQSATEASAPQPSDIHICQTLDDEALKILRSGGKVLVAADGQITYGKDIVQQWLPVFWNTSWFKMRPPHTTGLLIEEKHPLFRHFPTDYHSDLQWWHLVNRRQVMQFTEFPDDFQPIVQSIDTWFLSRKIGMLFEANVEGGRLLMTTMPLEGDTKAEQPYADCPAVAQMKTAILRYMSSDEFRPRHTIGAETIRHLFTKEAPKVNLFTNDSPDELKPKLK